jgi:hypothetical protein
MNDSIIDKLKAEHHQIVGLVEQIATAPDPTQKVVLYLDLKQALLPHLDGEDQSFYTHLKHSPHTEKAEQEQQKLREVLQQLDSVEMESSEWEELFQSLKQQLATHIGEVESEVFTEAQMDLSTEELIEIADDFDQVKANSHPY